MRCPSCDKDLNDDHPACPGCNFHIAQLDPILGPVPHKAQLLDRAGVIGKRERSRLLERADLLASRAGAELCVVTLPTSAPRKPAEWAFWLFDRWQVGGPGHEGLLVLLSQAEHRVECEVGWGIESAISDEASTALLNEHAVPFFRQGRWGEGLFQAVDVLAQLIEHARGGVG
jgi:uncharacterized protein